MERDVVGELDLDHGSKAIGAHAHAHADQAGLGEYSQMARHPRLALADGCRQIRNAQLALGDQCQQAQPRGLTRGAQPLDHRRRMHQIHLIILQVFE